MKSIGKQPELFDLGLANELYATLLGPVEALIKDKKQLLVVPSGALTALAVPSAGNREACGPAPSLDNFAPYRDAAWLIKRQAVTVLPSVASLKALRAFARKERAEADGRLRRSDVRSECPSGEYARQRRSSAVRSLTTALYTDFWRRRRRRSDQARASPAAAARYRRRTQSGRQESRRAGKRHPSRHATRARPRSSARRSPITASSISPPTAWWPAT